MENTTTDQPRSHLAKQIKKWRKACNFSQETLAARSNIDRTYISKLERGITNPSAETLVKLASSLGTFTSELIDNPTPNPQKSPNFCIIQLQMGYRIKLLRIAEGMSQETLALQTSVGICYISQLEQGNVNPSLLMLTKIAKELGTTVSELTKLSHPG